MVDLPTGFEAGAVDAGSAHACSTGLDGKLVCWGRNTDGQLGRGNSSPSESPGYVRASGIVLRAGDARCELQVCCVGSRRVAAVAVWLRVEINQRQY